MLCCGAGLVFFDVPNEHDVFIFKDKGVQEEDILKRPQPIDKAPHYRRKYSSIETS
jgi:hypothetical protein